MPIKPVKRPLNIQDALYFEDLIYLFRKIGGLDYEPNQETEERIGARYEEKEEIQVIIEGGDQSKPEKKNQFESIFLLHFSAYVTKILATNNVPSKDICNPAKGLKLLKKLSRTT